MRRRRWGDSPLSLRGIHPSAKDAGQRFSGSLSRVFVIAIGAAVCTSVLHGLHHALKPQCLLNQQHNPQSHHHEQCSQSCDGGVKVVFHVGHHLDGKHGHPGSREEGGEGYVVEGIDDGHDAGRRNSRLDVGEHNLKKCVHLGSSQASGRLLNREIKVAEAGRHHPHDIGDGQNGVAHKEARHHGKMVLVHHIAEHYKAQYNNRNQHRGEEEGLNGLLPLHGVPVQGIGCGKSQHKGNQGSTHCNEHAQCLSEQKDLKIITVIDDLDRLSINKIVEALDALKAFVGFPGCIFVVPFDDEIIKQALDKRRANEFNDRDRDEVVESELILDKLFQFKVYLPPLLDFDIQDYALSLAKQEIPDFLNEYCNEELMEKVIRRVLIHPSVSTPRQVKKLLNSFVNNYMVAFAREQSGKIEKGLLTSENG